MITNEKFLFNYDKYLSTTKNYKKLKIKDIHINKKITEIYSLQNKLDYFLWDGKHSIIQEKILTFGIVNSLLKTNKEFNKKDFNDKKILVINRHVNVLELLYLFLGKKFNEKNLKIILVPYTHSRSRNKFFKNYYNTERVPDQINLNDINIIKSKNIYIDDNLINDRSKYDFIFCSVHGLTEKYYNLIDKNINKIDKYIYVVLLQKYYLVRIIKMILNNINENGNVIMKLTGIVTENIANIVSLLVKNFLNYNIQFNKEFEDISPRLNNIFNITIVFKKFTPNNEIINKFNNLYTKIMKQYTKFSNGKIDNIQELTKLLFYNDKLDNDNEFIDNIKKYYNKKFDMYIRGFYELDLIFADKIKRELIFKENLIKAIKIAKQLNFTLKENYDMKKCINNYNDNLFTFFKNIRKHYYKIKNNKFDIKLITPKKKLLFQNKKRQRHFGTDCLLQESETDPGCSHKLF